MSTLQKAEYLWGVITKKRLTRKELENRLGQAPGFGNEMAVEVGSLIDAYCLYGGSTSKCALAFGRDR